jgi:hypothetical protein
MLAVIQRQRWMVWLLWFLLVPVAQATMKPVLNDWFALGSGCRAKSDLPGNVSMETLPTVSKIDSKRDMRAHDVYRVRFRLNQFDLDGGSVDPSFKKFGRECAIRLNINPPAGKRLVGLRGLTKVYASKESGPAVDILSELKLGSASLGLVQRRLDTHALVVAHEEVIDLRAGESLGEPLPQLGCGEPKIIGFDYSWIVTRQPSLKGQVQVALGREKSLIIEASLADCQSG